MRHDHAHHPSSNTSIEGFDRGVEPTVSDQPQDGSKVAQAATVEDLKTRARGVGGLEQARRSDAVIMRKLAPEIEALVRSMATRRPVPTAEPSIARPRRKRRHAASLVQAIP